MTVDGEELALFEWTPAARHLPAGLTPAEQAVALLAASGLCRAAIAERRGSSPSTVGKQLGAIYRKLGVDGRNGLIALLTRRTP